MQDYIIEPKKGFKGKRKYEMLDGKIYAMASPATSHNKVIGNIHNIFRNFLKGKPCQVFLDGVDVKLDEKNTVIPDVMIVCNRDIIKHDAIYGVPDLIVEVLSPSTAKRDISYKKDLYARHGVREYWIVNAADRSIQVYLLNDGAYKFDNMYQIYEDWYLKKMDEDEIAEIMMEFKLSLPGFEELIISVEEVFENVELGT